MSAYVVEDSTINTIVSFLSDKAQKCSHFAQYSEFAKLGYQLGNPLHDLRLANDLFDLNVDSVMQRYPGDDRADYGQLNFEYTYDHYIIQTIKSMRCLAYQSCEGDCDQRPLYKALDRTSADLALDVVQGMREYDIADWG